MNIPDDPYRTGFPGDRFDQYDDRRRDDDDFSDRADLAHDHMVEQEDAEREESLPHGPAYTGSVIDDCEAAMSIVDHIESMKGLADKINQLEPPRKK